MSQHNHAVIWIDHHEARIFHFDNDDLTKIVVHPDNPHVHIHHKADSIGSGHAAEDQNFLRETLAALGQAKAVLVTGPGIAKTELVKYAARHDPARMDTILAVETVDHPTDGQLVAHARRYFAAADRTTPQLP